MNGQPTRRRAAAPILASLVIAATLVPPLLDAGDGTRTMRIEGEHDPASCAVLHDHTACTQLAKSLGQLSPGATTLDRLGGVPRGAHPPRSLHVARCSDTVTPCPRAPPALFA